MCIVTGAGCAMNLFGIADVQLTRGKVVVYPLHDCQHVLPERHPLIPLSMGGLSVLHFGRKHFNEFGVLVHVLHTHKFMIMFNEVIITNKSSQSFIPVL